MSEVNVYRGIASLSSVDLFYMDSQAGDIAIIYLHGRCGRAETWYDFIQQYGNKYRVIAPDQRGHGLSGKNESSYTDKEMADDIIELMEYLSLKSAIIVGHSMGGAIAGYLAALYPQHVLAAAILDKSAAGPEKPLPISECMKNSPTKDWPLPFPSKTEAAEHIRKISCSDLEYRYFMSSLVETVEGYEMMFSANSMAIGIGQYVTWYQLLPQIQCPVLLIRSGSHESVPDSEYARMQALITDCTAHEMTHPDHNVHLADKEQFYYCMDGFLNHVMHLKTGV